LWCGDEVLGSYHRPEAAADDVSHGVTGYLDLDRLLESRAPSDLSEWERHVRR
jgi:hypothetical protein